LAVEFRAAIWVLNCLIQIDIEATCDKHEHLHPFDTWWQVNSRAGGLLNILWQFFLGRKLSGEGMHMLPEGVSPVRSTQSID
jgi:hypothetical protein